MTIKLQPKSTRFRFYILLLSLVCLGAVVKITIVLWPTPHQAQKPINPADLAALRRQAFTRLAMEYVSLDAPVPSFTGKYPCVYQSMQETAPGPRFGECETSWLSSGSVDRFEVDLRYGSFVLRQTDLFMNDVFEVPFTRAYNSSDWIYPNPVHAFGRHANQNYDIAPIGPRNPYTCQFLALDDANFIYFDRISKGTSFSDAIFRHTETSGKFYKAITYWNGDGWTTRLSDGSMIIFPESYYAKKIADGAPYEIVDAAGNKLLLQRDADRKLQRIRTPHGQEITLSYNDQGYVEHAQDTQGHWVVYLYDPRGMLTEVKDSSGHGRSYEYEGDNMTAIHDEKGNLLLRNGYEQGTLVAQQFVDGKIYQYAYRWSPNRQYAESALILLPDGTQQVTQTTYSVPGYIRNQR